MTWFLGKLTAQGGMDLTDTYNKHFAQSGAYMSFGNKGVTMVEERVVTEHALVTSETRHHRATITVPSGWTVWDVTWRNETLWTTTSTCLASVGDADSTNGYFTALNLLTTPASNVNGAGGLSSYRNIGSSGCGAYSGYSKRYPDGGTITVTVVGVNTAIATGVVAAGVSRIAVKMSKITAVASSVSSA